MLSPEWGKLYDIRRQRSRDLQSLSQQGNAFGMRRGGGIFMMVKPERACKSESGSGIRYLIR